MRQICIQEQIDAIREVSRRMLRSKRDAIQFLKSVGILKQSTDKGNTTNTATQFPGIDNSKVIVSSPNMIKENS